MPTSSAGGAPISTATVAQRERQTDAADKPSADARRFLILHEFPPPDLERAWRECLTRVEVPSHYNSPEYFLDPLRQGTRPFAVLAFESDRVRGVLTGFHLGSEVRSGLASRPQICVEGTETAATLETLAQGLLAESDDAGLVSLFTWSALELGPFSAHGFRSRQLPGSVVLDLTRGADNLFKEFSKDRRRNIRYAEKHGVEVREATSAQDIVDAHAVYSAWRGTDRKEVHGDWSFESFEKTMSVRSNRRLFLASFEGKVIAINIFRFFPGGLFESAANSSLDQFMHLKPNDLLQWRGIQWACAQGLRRHSLGGAHEFLLRFGGAVLPILRYRLDRTLFRRHDLKDSLGATARSLLRSAPLGVEQTVRRLLGKRQAH
jgi:hypothetical protein